MSFVAQTEKKEETSCLECGCVVPLTRKVDGALAHWFHKLGHVVGKYPWYTILASLLFVVVFCSGFFLFETEDRNEELWVPKGTEAQINFKDYSQSFSGSRVNRFSIASTDKGGNIFEADTILALQDLVEEITNIEVTVGGKNYTFNDLGVPTRAGFPPIALGIQSAFRVVEGQTTEQLLDQFAIATEATKAFTNLEESLGKITRDETGKVISAEATITVFLLQSGEATDEAAAAWEAEFLRVCLNGGQFDEKKNDEVSEWADYIVAYPFAQRTFADEFGEVVSGDVGLLGFSYAIITVYIMLNFGQCDAVKNKTALSLLVILTNMLSIGAGFGCSALFGFFFGPLHSVLPFVILGIGVDNAFVLVNAFGNTDPDAAFAIRSARSLSHSGASLTVTSSTDMVAFAVGSITTLPALSSFCAYAAITITMVYILSITFFQACVVLDGKRQDQLRYDMFCCCKSSKPAPEEKIKSRGMVSKFLEFQYGPCITSTIGITAALLFSAGMLAFGIYGFLQLSVESTQSKFIPDDSYAKASLNFDTENYKGIPDDTYVVVKDVDYFESHELLETIVEKFNVSAYAQDIPYLVYPMRATWFQQYKQLLPSVTAAENIDATGWPKTREVFDSTIFDLVSQGQLVSNLKYDFESKTILRSRMALQHQAIGEVVEGTSEFKEDTDKQVASMEKMYEIAAGISDDIYVFALVYVNEWETFKIIEQELVQNLSLALLCVYVITAIMIGHPLTSFLVFLCVLLTIVELLGVSWAWGLAIDTVSVVNLVIAVGLAVDYAAHLAHCTMLKTGTRKERVCQALGDIGAPVLNGAISTTLAVSLLAASKSYVFRVLFQQFFGACALGIVNGLVTLPALMAICVPASYRDVVEFDDESLNEEDKRAEKGVGPTEVLSTIE